MSDSGVDDRPAKKTRTRGAIACEACRNRRSKCDLLDELGCHRCKQLKTVCSLKFNGFGSNAHVRERSFLGQTSRDGETVALLAQQIEKLEAEVANLREQTLRPTSSTPHFDYSLSIHPPQISTPTSVQHGIQPIPSSLPQNSSVPTILQNKRRHGDGEKDRDEAWFKRWADPETFGLIDRGIHGKGERGLRDPIAEGIISEGQAEAAYQLFKYRFASVYPHPTLLLMHSSLPSQPFLLCASLYYAVRCESSLPLFTQSQMSHLEEYVFANLNAYHRGCRASLEGIMAAYILSFLPYHSTGNLTDPEAARMVGLAYAQIRELGQSVYLERLLQYLEAGIPVNYLEHQLKDARMFIGVINRSACKCQWASLPVLLESPQKGILTFLKSRGLDCPVDRHLIMEQNVLDVLNEHSRIWQDLQRNISPCVREVGAGNDLVRSAHYKLDDILVDLNRQTELQSFEYLQCHILYCKWWMTVRNVWSIYRLPVPLMVDEMYNAWLTAMDLAANASSDMLRTCLQSNWRLGCLPSAIGNAIILCFGAISTAIINLNHSSTPLTPALSIHSTIEQIQLLIQTSSPDLATLLSMTKTKLDEYKIQLQSQRVTGYANDDINRNEVFDSILPPERPNNLFSVERAGMGETDLTDLFFGLENWWSWPAAQLGEDTGWDVEGSDRFS